MGDLLTGLNIARNALLAQSSVLNTIAHNISNASTPGYSRQETQLVTAAAGTNFNNAILGGGVEATAVTRARFGLYDEIYREQNQNLNFNLESEQLLQQVEAFFSEPSDYGLSAYLDKFFNSWQELANSPQSQATRKTLMSVTEQLTERISGIYNSVVSMANDVNTEISKIPEEINQMADEIASLNVSIKVLSNEGSFPNDLYDKRDLLLDKLSEYGTVRIVDTGNSKIDVYLDSALIVHDNQSLKLTTRTTVDPTGSFIRTAIFTSAGSEFNPQSGRFGGIVNFRDGYSRDILEGLNTFAETLVNSVNSEHISGYGLDGITGRNFFDPENIKAVNISLSSRIDSPDKIAASADGNAGDNTIAFRINDIRDQSVINGIYSISDFYNGMIADLGVKSKGATSERQNQELLITQIDNSRENVKGVNLDEELVKMIESQRLYQSASRLISVMDTLLEEIVNIL